MSYVKSQSGKGRQKSWVAGGSGVQATCKLVGEEGRGQTPDTGFQKAFVAGCFLLPMPQNE